MSQPPAIRLRLQWGSRLLLECAADEPAAGLSNYAAPAMSAIRSTSSAFHYAGTADAAIALQRYAKHADQSMMYGAAPVQCRVCGDARSHRPAVSTL